ncbi:MCP four helix bundle domain-containing protein, partial [Methylobacterium sp. J-072]|uniref:MCP four helix bundle domain-containing protein n=1 Tax=Methylobacterium sp. J-072 TaxID=2836651 RepID=UPI001FB883CA
MSNLTIRARLIGALSLLFVLSAGLGAFCYAKLQQLSVATDSLGGNTLPSVRILGRLGADFEALRSRQLAYLVSNPERRPQSLTRLRASLSDVAKDLAEYVPFVSAGEEALWKAVATTVPAYTAMTDEYLRHLDAGDAKGASDYLLDGMLPALNAARAALKAAVGFNEAAGKQEATVAAELGRSGQFAILVVLGLVAAITLAVGWMSVTTISVPIRRMAGAMS